MIAGQFPAPEGGEHFSVVLDKDSPLTECVNKAIGQLRTPASSRGSSTEELSDNTGARSTSPERAAPLAMDPDGALPQPSGSVPPRPRDAGPRFGLGGEGARSPR